MLKKEWSFPSAPACSYKGRMCTFQFVDSRRPIDGFCVSGTELPHSVPDEALYVTLTLINSTFSTYRLCVSSVP